MIGNYKQAVIDGKVGRQSVAVRVMLTVVAALLLLTSVLSGLASPARAQEQAPTQQGLAESGPINPDNGFPFWYKDHSGAKLDLCLESNEATSKCLVPFELPEQAPEGWQQGDDFIFPDYFPGESFWWTSEAHIDPPADNPNGPSALLVLAAEAAFANEGAKEGDQMSFGRIRIRINDGVPGATYRVTHPYGVDTVVAEDKDGDPATPNDGRVFVTEDIGCFPTPLASCNFDKALGGRVGPFLKWDTFGNGTDNDDTTQADPELMAVDAAGNPDPNRPDAYFGDPDTPHKVVGSPKTDAAGNPQNYFKVEQLKDGAGRPLAAPVLVGETDLFSVTGKVAELQLAAEAVGAERTEVIFNDENQKIKLVASEPGAEVYYTTDGSEPGVLNTETGERSGTLYDPSGAGIGLNSDPTAQTGTDTRIRAVAGKDGQSSDELDKTYTVDLVAPNVIFGDLPSKLEGPSDLTITTNQKAKVFYTTDGSDPKDVSNPNRKSFVYDPAPEAQNTGNIINIARSQTVRAAAIDLNFNEVTGQDEEGTWSQTKSRKFNAANLKVGPVNPENGFPFWYEDHNGTRLDMCLNPIVAPEAGGGYCATPFEMPADWQPGDGIRFPDRFPGEAFWFTAESGMETSEDGEAGLVMAMEAAFANEEPNANDRMAFGRIRIRIDDLTIGETYKITHPYGVDTYVAEDNGKGSGEINVTEDIGCMMPSEAEPCDFNESRFSRVGPFLTLVDKSLEPTNAPDGGHYLADPVTDQDVVQGSPITALEDPNNPNSQMVPANFFRIEGPGLQGTEDSPLLGTGTANPYKQTEFFSIVGKYSEFQAAASETGGFYNKPLSLTLGASEFDARIFYTLDSSDPIDASGQPTAGAQEFVAGSPIQITDNGRPTTLKYAAVSASQPQPTKVYTEVYTVDTEAPVVVAEDTPPANDTVDGTRVFNDVNPSVKLNVTNDEPGKVKVYYTTNGTDPSDATNVDRALYDVAQPIAIREDTTLKFWAIDEAGNASTVGSQAYDIVDTIAPDAPTLDLAATSDTGVSDNDDLTSNPDVTINGTAEAGSAVAILVNGTQGASVTAAADGSFSANISGLESGLNEITATATDAAGNQSAASVSLNVEFDTSAPAVPTADPAAGNYDATQQVRLAAAEGRIFYTLNGSEPTTSSTQFTADSTPISVSRTTTVRAISVDDAGNTAAASFDYVINAFAPTVTNISPNNVNTRDRTPVIRATVLDRDRDLTLGDITLRVDGTVINDNQITYNANTGALRYTPRRNLAVGNVPVSVRVTDAPRPAVLRSWSFTIRR